MSACRYTTYYSLLVHMVDRILACLMYIMDPIADTMTMDIFSLTHAILPVKHTVVWVMFYGKVHARYIIETNQIFARLGNQINIIVSSDILVLCRFYLPHLTLDMNLNLCCV